MFITIINTISIGYLMYKIFGKIEPHYNAPYICSTPPVLNNYTIFINENFNKK